MTSTRSSSILASSGERLRVLLGATGLSAHQFAGYWAGYPVGAPVPRRDDDARGRRFRSYRRALFRWLSDGQAIADANAYEIVAVANRLLAEQGSDPFPPDWLVTRPETRLAGLEELGRKLDEVLDRLARIEERLA